MDGAASGPDFAAEAAGAQGAGERVAAALRRWRRALFPGRGADAPVPGAALWLGPRGVARSTRPARVLLGTAGAPGATPQEVARALAPDEPDLAEALEALALDGEPFRRRATMGDAVYEIEGAPEGRWCRIALRDVTDEARALERAERARLAAEAELAALRAALDASPQAVWRLSPTGAPIWTTTAAAGAPPPSAPTARAATPDGGEIVLRGGVSSAAADEALRRFVGTVSEAFSHLRVGLAIFDSSRRLLLANPAVSKMFGAEEGWLAGRPSLREMLDRLREARLLPEQADYPAWRAALFTLFDDPSRAFYEDIWELPDGRGIHVIGRPHPAGGIAFMFEDYTESMALQRWRSTSIEVRRATLDLLEEGVVVFGPDGRARIANPAFRRMWGFVEELDVSAHVSAIADRCRERLASQDEDEDLWRRIRAAVASGGARAPWSDRTTLKDGRTLSARIAPMPDGSTLAAFADLTDAERVAAALADRAAAHDAAEEMRTALVDQLSHRLRTPLNAILGFADLLRSGRAGELPPRQRQYVETIHDASTRLLEGVESLSDLASIHGGEVSLSKRDLDLAPALRGAVELLRARAGEKGVRLAATASGQDLLTHGDPARLRQMIFNLLSDALAVAESGATLETRLERRDREVALVCDRPAGAEPPGLAFALARRVAEMHGGGAALTIEDGRAVSLCRLPAAATPGVED